MAKPAASIALNEFADDHGVTVRTVTNWLAAGMPHRTVRGERRVVRVEANRWLRERDREGEREKIRDQETPDEARERARKTKWEADIKEMEAAERRGQLVPQADYLEALEKFTGNFAAVAAGRLARFERAIVTCATPAEARKVTQEIHAALMAGAQDYATQLEAAEAEGEPEEPAA